MPDEPPAAARGDHDDDAGTLPPGHASGSSARVIIGVVLLLIGLAIAVVAFVSRGDDSTETTSLSSTSSTSSSTTAPVTTPTSPVGPQAPTTIPDQILPTGCGDWDAAFSFAPEPVAGVAIYSDFDGWHVRLGPGGPATVTGAVIGQGVPVLASDPLPEGVEATEHPAGNALLFTIRAGSEPIGFDFGATCGQKQLTFVVDGPDGEPVPADAIQVGRSGFVTSLPVVAQRTQRAPG